jgi:enamine deaminase RidA (YjgF/YER057c/UK114 family)
MDLHAQLASLGLQLPPAPNPVASYVPAVRTGPLIFVSGQLPFIHGQLPITGPVPSRVTLEQAQAAARTCALNALAIVDPMIRGDWSRLARIVRVGVFVASDNAFIEQPKVANGASDLLVQLFGEKGKHARTAVGANVLPLNAPVELELTLELTDPATP